MSEMSFTPAQQDAIQASGGSAIVSAAAGSGKTRVLVQRVLRLLTDPVHPVDADRLLMVTFTKAAAEEMRSRIASAIDERLFYEPDNTLLRRQQSLLPRADICTIHSFCSKVIRENFYLLDIDQDFRIASEAEGKVLQHRVLSELIEEQYQTKDSGFLLLSELLSSTKSDKDIEKAFIHLYEKSSTHPFPSAWLDKVAAFYDPSVPVGETIYAMVALERLKTALPYLQYMWQRAADIVLHHEAFCTGTKTCGENKLVYLQQFLQKLKEAVDSEQWDRLSACISGFQKAAYRKPSGKNKPDEDDCVTVKNSFDSIDNMVLDTLQPIFQTNSEAFRQDTEQLYPAVLTLTELLKVFEQRYFEAKKGRELLDFSDLEHLMLRLLVQQDADGMHKTAFAHSLSQQYDQIMVDEYQDTNETQECIFRFVSRDEQNLFVVGDIKQSIYRFREARPEIFKQRRQQATLYDEKAPQFPAKIILDKNFRSRSGIIDSVNFVFHAIMSERVGEITYNEEEELTAGKSYPDWTEPSAELYLMDSAAINKQLAEQGEKSSNPYVTEAKYIAQLIREKVDRQMMVTEDGQLRPVRYGDFAILMRILSTHGQEYADTLNQCGIPAYIDKSYSLFGCYEINILLSLLKMIDNPLQDIPALGVLLSPVFGFTPDDLADMKSQPKGRFLFNKLYYVQKEPTSVSEELLRKIDYFMKQFSDLRKLSVTMSVSRVLHAFFDRTGFLPMMTAAENGDIRLKNIRKFMSFVQDYEKGGKTGLTEFVRYLNHLEENGTDISVSDTVPTDAVKIMSVHHSKGLEFPVCILAGLNAQGGKDKDEVLYHPDLGFGFKTMDRDNLLRFNSLQRNVITLCKEAEETSEAMRILYVAMTRAKEQLIAVVNYSTDTEDSLNKKLQQLAERVVIEDGRLSPYAVEGTSSLADWLVMCALVHPSLGRLREESGMFDGPVLPCQTAWHYERVTALTPKTAAVSAEMPDISPDASVLALLQQRFGESYRYQQRTVIPSKVSASSLVHTAQLDFHIAESRPAFMQEENMTGAEKGTAMHTFLQYADLKVLQEGTEQEKQRLVREGFLTPEQAKVIDTRDVEGFLHSGVYADICSAEQILREYRFTVNLPASDIDPSYSSEDSVILQGAMDCLLVTADGLIIIDYKTDKVKEAQNLAQRYRTQLLLYRKAAQQLFDKPVKKCCIYSLYRAEEVTIDS